MPCDMTVYLKKYCNIVIVRNLILFKNDGSTILLKAFSNPYVRNPRPSTALGVCVAVSGLRCRV